MILVWCAADVRAWLRERVSLAVMLSLADSTVKQYGYVESHFVRFALYLYQGEEFMPASDQLLCEYLVWKSLTVDPKNLKTHLSGVRHLHERLGFEWRPVPTRFAVHRCLMGLKRLCVTPVKRKLPITPGLLLRMRQCRTIDWGHPAMVVVWAAMLVAFFCFLRKDNFTVQKPDSFNTRLHLTRGDIKRTQGGFQFTFRHSKTNQIGARVHRTAVAEMRGSLLDPVLAIQRAFALCPRARAADPAFAIPQPVGPPVPLTHHAFVRALKFCLREIGVDPSLYSGHSFRRGGATFAHRLSVDPLLNKIMGDWSSDAFMAYIDKYSPENMVRLPLVLAAACARLA